MSSKSESLAFEPSPAIDHEKENFSPHDVLTPLNSQDEQTTLGRSSKEVHFSPVAPPARRAQSLATATVPLLDPIPSASQLPRQSLQSRTVAPQIDIEAYIQSSRALLEAQRDTFDRERNSFEQERMLWNAERAILHSRIASLESTSSKQKGGKRRYSNDSSNASAQSFRSDFGRSSFGSTNGSRVPSMSSAPPVWETPDMSGTVTRVFSNEESQKRASKHLPSIAEGHSPPNNDNPLSPRSIPVDNASNISIPIEKIDSALDGITLRLKGLPSTFVARIERGDNNDDNLILKSEVFPPSFAPNVMTPPSASPQPSPSPKARTAEQGLQIKMSDLLLPSDEKLKLHAGHTPMAFGKRRKSETKQSKDSSAPIERPATEEDPHLPQLRPKEDSDSYFPSTDNTGEGSGTLDEDPELKGKLSLDKDNNEGKSNAFLNELDAKLLMEAKRILRSPMESTAKEDEKADDQEADEEEVPALRIRKSINFGSAFGSMHPGKI